MRELARRLKAEWPRWELGDRPVHAKACGLPRGPVAREGDPAPVLRPDVARGVIAFLGAVLFVISDSVLALDRFRGEFGAARALTLSTYYAAQWLIASSVV